MMPANITLKKICMFIVPAIVSRKFRSVASRSATPATVGSALTDV